MARKAKEVSQQTETAREEVGLPPLGESATVEYRAHRTFEMKEQPDLYAYADFELLGKSYSAGDKFVVPEGFERAPQMDEHLNASKRKNDQRTGIAFSYQGEIINPQAEKRDQERRVHIAVLPLEEK